MALKRTLIRMIFFVLTTIIVTNGGPTERGKDIAKSEEDSYETEEDTLGSLNQSNQQPDVWKSVAKILTFDTAKVKKKLKENIPQNFDKSVINDNSKAGSLNKSNQPPDWRILSHELAYNTTEVKKKLIENIPQNSGKTYTKSPTQSSSKTQKLPITTTKFNSPKLLITNGSCSHSSNSKNPWQEMIDNHMVY